MYFIQNNLYALPSMFKYMITVNTTPIPIYANHLLRFSNILIKDGMITNSIVANIVEVLPDRAVNILNAMSIKVEYRYAVRIV